MQFILPDIHTFGLFLSLLFFCSCTTQDALQPRLPPTVAMNKNAGRGSMLIMTLRLKSGERLPFVVDTGSPITVFDKSLEPKLGPSLATGTFWHFGAKILADIYAAPELYSGNTRLVTSTNIWAFKLDLPSCDGVPVMGILGMDVLGNYCIQLDFSKGEIYFLKDERMNRKELGKPFPLADIGEGRCDIGENLVGAKGPVSVIDTGCDSDGWLTAKLFQQSDQSRDAAG